MEVGQKRNVFSKMLDEFVPSSVVSDMDTVSSGSVVEILPLVGLQSKFSIFFITDGFVML